MNCDRKCKRKDRGKYDHSVIPPAVKTPDSNFAGIKMPEAKMPVVNMSAVKMPT